MSKVICDICGTAYPETEENCPVCGCSRDFGLDALEEELLMESAGIQQNTKKKTREIFDFDEVNQEEEPETNDDFDEDDEVYEREPRSNMALVVILLVLIVLLLVAAGVFYIRYFLPNMVKETEPTETTAAAETIETEPTETTELTIPCTDIVVPGGKIELGKDGKWLMNVQVYPADTTDVLTYASHDEAVVTVSEDGTVTAVGEGETVIEVICGAQTIKCNVIVAFDAVEVTEAAGEIPAPQVEETGATEATETASEPTDATEATDAAASTEATDATDAAEETTGSMELKLKKNDITMFARYTSADLELDCDIPMEDITWFTMDSTVAIVHNGTVTATGSGMTRIYGEYNGQQVECIVRCTF